MAPVDELLLSMAKQEQGLTDHDRQVLCLQKARPLLEQINAPIEAARIDVLPKSHLAKAGTTP